MRIVKKKVEKVAVPFTNLMVGDVFRFADGSGGLTLKISQEEMVGLEPPYNKGRGWDNMEVFPCKAYIVEEE